MGGQVNYEPAPAWAASGNPALPWAVQPSQYAAGMAGYLDAAASGGSLWQFTRNGEVTENKPESIAYRDASGAMDPVTALAHVQAVTADDTITYDYTDYQVQYCAELDRLKLTIVLRSVRPPDATLVDLATATLTLMGGIVIPAALDIWDNTGHRNGNDFTTMGEIWLKDAQGNVVQHFARVTAEDAAGNHYSGTMSITTDVDGTRRLWLGLPWSALEVATFPVTIDPTVVTSTSSLATACPNQRKSARFNSNGYLFDMLYDGSNIICRYSSDNGQTWQTPSAGATLGAYTSASVWVIEGDSSDILHVAAANSSGLYYLRGVPNAGRTSYTWSVSTVNTYAVCYPPACIAHLEGSGAKMNIAVNWADGAGTDYVSIERVGIASDGTVTPNEYGVSLASLITYMMSYPAIAVDASKNLAAVWSSNTTGTGKGVRAKFAPYSGGTWPWGSAANEAVTEAAYATQMGSAGFDSTGRLYVCFQDNSGNIRLFRRAAAGGWSDVSPSPSQAGSNPTLTVDTDKNAVYVTYTNGKLVYRKYDGSTWGSETTLNATATAAYPSARPTAAGSAVDVLATYGSGSPYTVTSDRITLNTAPQAPTLTASATAFDAADGITITATAHDSDPGDTVSAIAWKRVVGGVTRWWKDADKDFTQTSEYYNTVAGSVTSVSLAAADTAGKFTNGTSPQIYASTKDAAGATGPYNATPLQLTVAAKPVATLTSPGVGATINTSKVTEGWSLASGTQASYQAKAVAAGSDPATAPALGSSDTGEQTDAAARSRTLDYTGTNGTQIRPAIRVKSNDGVWGDWVHNGDVAFSFTPPLTAQNLSAAADKSHGAITVTWDRGVNPGNQNDSFGGNWRVDRRRVGATGWVELDQVANPGAGSSVTYTDYTPAAGASYEYQVIAIGNNGTESAGVTATASVTFTTPWLIHLSDSTQNLRLPLTQQELIINNPQTITDQETLGSDRKSRSVGSILGAEFEITVIADHRDPRTFDMAEQLRTRKALSTTWLLKLPQAPHALMASIPGRLFEVSLGAFREVVSSSLTAVTFPALEVGDARD